MASRPGSEPILQRDTAMALHIPNHFLGKILQVLKNQGIVASRKGKSGGFVLNSVSRNISLYDIVLIMDGPALFNRCFLGFPGCSDRLPCPVHEDWQKARSIIIKMLKERSVEQFHGSLSGELSFIKSSSEDSIQ